MPIIVGEVALLTRERALMRFRRATRKTYPRGARTGRATGARPGCAIRRGTCRPAPCRAARGSSSASAHTLGPEQAFHVKPSHRS